MRLGVATGRRSARGRDGRRCAGAAGIGLALMLAALPLPARALNWLEETTLIDVAVGSFRSDTARALGRGGYELADGRYRDFSDWYEPDLREINLLFVTPLADDLGLLWGFGTGERGEKYRIAPALRLGVALRRPVGRKGSLVATVVGVAGGDLDERPCTADYGAIGGVQQVNCRLAAGLLPPAETLRFLARVDGSVETVATLRLEFRF